MTGGIRPNAIKKRFNRDVFNIFLLIDATDRSKISSDQKHFFIALSLYPLSFFANTPFNDPILIWTKEIHLSL